MKQYRVVEKKTDEEKWTEVGFYYDNYIFESPKDVIEFIIGTYGEEFEEEIKIQSREVGDWTDCEES